MPYDFTPDGFSKFTEAVIGAEGDQATVSTLQADMQGTFIESVASQQSLQNDMQNLRSENNRLLEANSKLFLKVGQQINQENGGIV